MGMDGCDAVSAEYSSEGTRVGRGGVRGGLGAGAPLVMMALVAAGTLNSSAANCRTAVNGATSGTLSLRTRSGEHRERGGVESERDATAPVDALRHGECAAGM